MNVSYLIIDHSNLRCLHQTFTTYMLQLFWYANIPDMTASYSIENDIWNYMLWKAGKKSNILKHLYCFCLILKPIPSRYVWYDMKNRILEKLKFILRIKLVKERRKFSCLLHILKIQRLNYHHQIITPDYLPIQQFNDYMKLNMRYTYHKIMSHI